MTSRIEQVSVATIQAGDNDRKHFDDAKLAELAQSIEQHGLAQPITIRPIGADHFEIVAGERRYRAVSQILRWKTIPAIIKPLSDEEAAAIMLAENTGRADLDPVEEASAYRARIDRFGWDIAKVAKVAGVSEDLVTRRLSLLQLVPEAQGLVASGNLPIGHAEAITPLDANRQRIALRVYNSGSGLALSDFRKMVGQLLEEQQQDSLFDIESFWTEQAQRMAEMPRRGKKAVTGAPIREDLPAVRYEPTDSAAQVIDRFIAELLHSGKRDEAAVIGTLYTALVHGNFMSVPSESKLLDC